MFHPMTHDIIESVGNYGLETTLRNSNGATSISKRNIELDASGGLNSSTVRHETGHIALEYLSQYDSYIDNLLNKCIKANSDVDNYYKSIGCDNILDVLRKYKFVNELNNSLKLELGYKFDVVEAWYEGLSKSDKYIDIKEFESIFNNELKDIKSSIEDNPISNLHIFSKLDSIISGKSFDIFERYGVKYDGQLKQRAGTNFDNEKFNRSNEDNNPSSDRRGYYNQRTVGKSRVTQEEITKLQL